MRSVLIYCGLLCALVGGRWAWATSPQDSDSSVSATSNGKEYKTEFDDPQTGSTPGNCTWAAIFKPPGDPHEAAGPGVTTTTWENVLGWDLYDTKHGWNYETWHGYGQMFVWGYAFDNHPGSQDIAESHTSNSWIQLQRTDTTTCTHIKHVDLKPQFKIRVDVLNPSGGSTNSIEIMGHVIEVAPNIGVTADLTGTLKATDEGSSGGGMTLGAKAGPLEAQVPVPIKVESGDQGHRDLPFIHPLVSGERPLNWERVDMQTADAVNAHADGWTVWGPPAVSDDAEVNGYLYESLAGVKLRAWCRLPVPEDPPLPPPPTTPPTGTGDVTEDTTPNSDPDCPLTPGSPPPPPPPGSCTGTRWITCSWY